MPVRLKAKAFAERGCVPSNEMTRGSVITLPSCIRRLSDSEKCCSHWIEREKVRSVPSSRRTLPSAEKSIRLCSSIW